MSRFLYSIASFVMLAVGSAAGGQEARSWDWSVNDAIRATASIDKGGVLTLSFANASAQSQKIVAHATQFGGPIGPEHFKRSVLIEVSGVYNRWFALEHAPRGGSSFVSGTETTLAPNEKVSVQISLDEAIRSGDNRELQALTSKRPVKMRLLISLDRRNFGTDPGTLQFITDWFELDNVR